MKRLLCWVGGAFRCGVSCAELNFWRDIEKIPLSVVIQLPYFCWLWWMHASCLRHAYPHNTHDKRHSIEWRLSCVLWFFKGLFAQTFRIRFHAAADGLKAFIQHVELRGQQVLSQTLHLPH